MARTARARAFTLIEVMIVVVLLGIAGALVIPSMSQASVLRVQSTVRTVVADITYLQGEAMAYQGRRAIWFGKVAVFDADAGAWTYEDGNGYTMCEVRGAALNLATDALPDPDNLTRPLSRNFDDARYAGARIQGVDFNGGSLLIFDELGGPVLELDGPDPGAGGSLEVIGSGSTFRVDVQPYTGRVTVTQTADPSDP